MTTRPEAGELLATSMQTADIAAGRFADDLHDPYAETLLHEASTLALQSIAASLIRIGNTMNCLDANLDLLREQLEPLDIRPGDQAQSRAVSQRCAQSQVTSDADPA